MNDSNVYIVSPPTLHLPNGGLSFCLISNNQAWQDTIINAIEKGIQNKLTFYTNENAVKDPKAWVWYWHVASNCSLIIVDTASCTEHEIRMALAMCKHDLPILFNLRPTGNDDFLALLTAIQIPSFEDVEQLLGLVEAGLVG